MLAVVRAGGAFVVGLILLCHTAARAQTDAPQAHPATSAPPPSESSPTEPAEHEYYYFRPDGVGAHAFYNPQNFIVQGGLGAVYEERLDTFPWAGGFKTLNRSLMHPVKAVEDYGVERFFYREFLPHPGAGQNYAPNWFWHFMGGGMRTKLMEEYFTHHGFRQPRVWAWLTMYTFHYLNEAVQAARFARYDRYTIDPLPDMLFFDWVGGVFFRFDPINRFMSRTLHMREWSFQAQYNPLTQRLFNNGQLYWMRLALFDPVSISLLTGEQITSLNLTFGWGAGHQLSAGLGPQAKAFVAKNNGDTDPSTIVYSVGMFYSVDDNPILTMTYEPPGRHAGESGRWLANLYPSFLQVFGQRLAMTLAYHREAVFVGTGWGPLPAGVVFSTPRLENR